MKKFWLILLATVILLGIISGMQYLQYADGKLHVIFCNVGQGDGIVIKTPNQKLLMVDAGPDRAILDCLTRHTPFWVRTIDIAALTHPHADHFFGYFFIIPRYKITTFATEGLVNETASYQALAAMIASKPMQTTVLGRGAQLQEGGVTIDVLGPSEEYLSQASPNGRIGETKELASLELLVSYKNFTVLLTGDSQTAELNEAVPFLPDHVDVLQTPHHGSASGVDDSVIAAINPAVVAISVGKQNRYGHPNPKVLDIYAKHEIPVYRTDQRGDVEFVSNGLTWTLAK